MAKKLKKRVPECRDTARYPADSQKLYNLVGGVTEEGDGLPMSEEEDALVYRFAIDGQKGHPAK